MSSVKISGLNPSSNINVDPAQSVFPTTDQITGDTTKISAKDLGDTLYSNNIIIVGSGGYVLPNLVAQFTGVGPSYVQVNAQNLNANGSADFVITADDGNDSAYYLDLGINNSLFADTNFSSMKPHDGYLYVHGDGSPAVGNLVIGTATSGANIVFIVGGTHSENVRVKIANSGIVLDGGSSITFKDGTLQETAAAPNNYTRSAYTMANNANVYAFSAYSYANTINAYAYSTNDWVAVVNTSVYTANTFLQSNDALTLANAKSYTDTANTYIQSRYLANTTGTFNGTLDFSGSVNSNGFINLINPNVVDNSVFLKISGAAGGASQLPSNPGYTIHTTSIDGQGNRVTADAFGSSANNYASFVARRGRGTASSPTALQSGDIIARFAGNGYGASKFSQYGDGRIEIVAAENFTDNSKHTRIEFYTTNIGSNSANLIATFNGGNAVFSGIVNPQKGFVYTPNVVSSNVSTFNIDIANTSLHKLSCNSGLTISLSGFQWGKVVEVWLTNYAGSTQTITHGCSAINSTTNSTTFTMPSSSSAYLKYFSIDGDLANTYVSIQHA